MKKNVIFPIHSILLAIFPAVSLMSHNLGQISLIYIVRPVIFSALTALFLLIIFNLVIKDFHKSGLIVSTVVLAFSSYGIIYDWIESKTLFGFGLNHRLGLALGLFLLWVIASIFVLTRKNSLRLANQFFLVFGLVAVLLPAGQITYFQITNLFSNETPQRVSSIAVSEESANNETPDIYYFILDGYSRSDMLERSFNFDNSAFIHDLESRGFYVAKCSLSNYGNTRLSLTSTLNMEYLSEVAPQAKPNVQSMGILDEKILHSKVRNELESMGYEIVSFQTGFLFSEFHDADYYVQTTSVSLLSPYLSPFESLLLNETGFRILERHPKIKLWSIKSPLYEKYLIEKNKIEYLNKISLPSPKFVFVHLMAAHRPYIFTATGEVQNEVGFFSKDGRPEDTGFDKKGYINGLRYLNESIVPIIDHLQATKNPPIIIIQGDHGNLRLKQREILNAYYFPDSDYQALYPSITPVNSFRVVFDQYFGYSLPLLPDRSFASKIDPDPFVLEETKEKSPICIE